ncbi:MAG TPA: DUF4190 domain-containing protein [Candidatus Ruania gallistercoris]|uniref:DUF4190 domain-containing protein n=1 Tax=Candidatus Ruania gallistercoris TaxID=2838746 RepID=A0A9D2EAJ4_9MICO|nr:DUF4190 domain-containing protein [Candidatus Ruania gallistercoris]
MSLSTSPYDNSYTLPMPDPAVTFAGPGYFTPQPRSSAAATIAFICAFIGVVTFIPSLAAVIVGIVALRQIARDRLRGRGLAEAAVALGALVLLGWSALLAAVFLLP